MEQRQYRMNRTLDVKLKQVVHNTFKSIAYGSTLLMVFPLYEIIQVVIESSSNGFIFIDNEELSNRFFFDGLLNFLGLGYIFLISSYITLKTNKQRANNEH